MKRGNRPDVEVVLNMRCIGAETSPQVGGCDAFCWQARRVESQAVGVMTAQCSPAHTRRGD
jgi:hypothetical protein